ncbi:MAG: hypothetical protein LBE78_10490 [Burkholderiaceae bacterium]|nr:hypothetical protein [Burkholderiaceae bacterium]
MKTMQRILAAGLLVAGGLGTASMAQAGVHWSVGVNVPGVAVGVGAPVAVYPQPAYYPAAYPYYAPAYVAPPVYYGVPRPVYRPARVHYGRPVHRHRAYRGGRHH